MILKRLELEKIIKTDTTFYVLKRGETIASLLSRIPFLTPELRKNVLDGLSLCGLDFNALKEGESCFLCRKGEILLSFTYCQNEERIFQIFFPQGVAMPYQRKEVKTERVKGKIASSLYESILRIGEKGELAVRFAEILEWDIDFWSDVQTEDSFQILVEKIYVDSKPVRYGKIYLVNYSGKIGNFYGINFNGNYYDREGKSLRRAFLKSPLRYSYISSYFSRARFHPILRVIRPHRGVDYVAPTGTPVSALGAGTVTFAGWRGGYGKLVVIRHPNGYVTKYGHLSRIRKGIYPGKNVRQGELIGYVGATGLATGPHLHFEVLKDNSWVNPLKLSSPPQEPVPPESMAHFIAFRDSLLKLVER